MKRIVAGCLCCIVSGCTVSHSDGGFTPVSSVQVMNKVLCELQDVAKTHPYLKAEDWTVVAQLTLESAEASALGATLTGSDTLSRPGESFSATAPVSLGNARLRKFEQSYSIAIKNLDDAACGKSREMGAVVRGDLDVARLVQEGSNARAEFKDRKDIKTTTRTDATAQYVGTITFTASRSFGDLGLTWTLRHFSGPGNILSLSRTDVNSLTLAFVKPETKVAVIPASAGRPARIIRVPAGDPTQEGLKAIELFQNRDRDLF